MRNRIQEIKSKGFEMKPADSTREAVSTDFSKIKVGIKSLEDAVLELGDLRAINSRLADKKVILKAIHDGDLATMREVSNLYYKMSGIYGRLLRYMAYLYKYDWVLTPYIYNDKANQIVIDKFHKILAFLDNFEAKKVLGEISLKVLKNGCYYGYQMSTDNKVVLQELPIKYCRSRYSRGNRPVVEFNMKYFDDAFKDAHQRQNMLKLFPEEFTKGYAAYKKGLLTPEVPGDASGWYMLDPTKTVKFNLNDSDYPLFISVIPALIDLEEAQALDRKKMAQRLLKIIIQKMPFDKNGDLIFDVDEAQALHNNAVRMLGKAIGIDVLTTFADVDVADLADRSTTTTVDDLEKVERTVYNESGVAQNLFNTSGNLALEKSILNDEASMHNLILQYEAFLNDLLIPFNTSPKKFIFKVEILNTTIYNYKELAKLYQEQAKNGFSKWLPQIALGMSQSSILATAHFENNILHLSDILIPLMNSNTMSSKDIQRNGEDKQAGRKELPDDQKSEKTLANIESMN